MKVLRFTKDKKGRYYMTVGTTKKGADWQTIDLPMDPDQFENLMEEFERKKLVTEKRNAAGTEYHTAL